MEREIWWTRGRKLGSGSFGVVSLAEADFNPPLLMAVKSAEVSLSGSLRKERSLLHQLEGCPYLISCFGDEVSSENGVELYNIMLEYASGGSLADRIKNCGKGLSEHDVRRYTKTVVMGLSHIHKQGYVHCDIKPHNILLVSGDSCSSSSSSASSLIMPNLKKVEQLAKLKKVEEIAKIADFGLTRKIAKRRSPKLIGTPMYLAPECVRHQEYQPHSDIWALGCTVLQLITGKTPWHCERHTEASAILYRIGCGKTLPDIPSWVSAEAKDFLKNCLVDNPESRWSADMLLGHPFLSSIDTTKNVEEERIKDFYCETRNTECDSLSQSSSSSSSVNLLIKPYKILSKRGFDRQQDVGELPYKKRKPTIMEEVLPYKKRKPTMEVVQEAQQQPNTTYHQRYWGVKRIEAVYDSRDNNDFSSELLW